MTFVFSENSRTTGTVFPGGTVNDVAKTLGLSLDPILAAQDIVTGREFPIDIGAFGKDRWFVYVAAFGLFTGVSYQTPQEDKQVLGRLADFLHGVKALGEVISYANEGEYKAAFDAALQRLAAALEAEI